MTNEDIDDFISCPVIFFPVPGTREAAFVHSISAAGVGYEVTRACSSGYLQKCGCDRTVTGTSDEGFTWSGCSDNVNYGRCREISSKIDDVTCIPTIISNA